METESAQNELLITLTSDIVAAHVSNNSVAVSDVSSLIQNVHAALSALNQPVEAPEVRPEPAVSIRASIKPDYIVCLEDGKKLKMLKRHLRAEHGLSESEYRIKFNLDDDHPLVAPNYSLRKADYAKKAGLGRYARDEAVQANLGSQL